MVWRELLLTATIVATSGVLSIAHTGFGACTPNDLAAGICSAANASTDHVDVSASTGGFGSPHSSGGRDRSDDVGDSGTALESPPVTEADIICMDRTQCRRNPAYAPEATPAPAAPGAPTAPTVSMAQVASFYPQPPTTQNEPAGWAIVGLPTNLVSGAATNTASGTLLGGPAEVRFTPLSWSWDYGDGASATTGTGGDTWQHLGVRDFSTTATSHVYAARGIYTVHTTVTYTAAYRVAGGAWLPVAGTLSLRAPETVIDVRQPSTVLVEDDCHENPRGPGC